MNALTTTKTPTTNGANMAANAPERRLSGVALVPAGVCQYGAAIGAGDVLRVDFDRGAVTTDGLYLLEAMGADGVEWVGCRRFARGLDGGLSVDDTGRGDWREVGAGEASGYRVAGRVEQVYRAV